MSEKRVQNFLRDLSLCVSADLKLATLQKLLGVHRNKYLKFNLPKKQSLEHLSEEEEKKIEVVLKLLKVHEENIYPELREVADEWLEALCGRKVKLVT